MSNLTLPPLPELFGTADPAAAATRLELLKGALNKSAMDQQARSTAGAAFDAGSGTWIQPDAPNVPTVLNQLSKMVSPDALASITAELGKAGAVMADIGKDITLTSPLAAGLVPFDLEAPAKFLVPVLTPLRNMIPRVKGQGTSRQFKRILGITGSGTGGVANLSPFLADGTTDTFGGLTLQRPKKISYAADQKTYNYKQAGLSDSVTWSAEFAGLGFQDMRQLSQTAVLYASMLMDEKALLGARGTDAGVYIGATGVPNQANVTLSVRTSGTGETGNSANIATLYVKLASEGIFGSSIASASINTTGMSAATGKVVDLTMTGAMVAGVSGYLVYVSTDNVNFFYAGRTAMWGGAAGQATAAFTIQFTGGGTGGTINSGAIPAVSDTAANANAWDGLLTVQMDPAQSGGIYAANGPLSVSNPGNEIQQLCVALYHGGVGGVTGATTGGSGVKASPKKAWAHGMDRKQLSDTVKIGASTNPSFIMTSAVSNGNLQLGTIVSAIVNEVTGDVIDVEVHPWMPQGNMLVLSDSIPTPDSGVGLPYQYVLPQDYMAINWPVIQTTYDISSYWFGALVHYAPAFSGVVTGIKAVS